MAGKCPTTANIKKLKGGVSCIDAKNNTCFCSKAGCKCDQYFEPIGGQGAKNFDAQYGWCEQYDPGTIGNDGNLKFNNQWCKNHMPIKDSVAGNTAAGITDATKSTLDAFNKTFSMNNMTTVAIIGIGVLALFMMIS